MSAVERASGASIAEPANGVVRANGRASGPVLRSVILVVLAHSEMTFIIQPKITAVVFIHG